MTNPYNQPTKCVSTTTSWFNPSGTAHYVRPILQPDIYVETNNTLERIIAGNSVRVAKLESLLKEKRDSTELKKPQPQLRQLKKSANENLLPRSNNTEMKNSQL
ncbi:unnamed protein product [Alternaria alternata]